VNLVFDFAGVLFRWDPAGLISQVLPAHAPTRQAAQHWAGEIFQGYGGDWAAFDRGVIEPDALALRIAARTGLAATQARAVIDAVPVALEPIAGTVDLLERLHQAGRALFFLSNMPAPYARHLEARHAFIGLFRRGVFSADVRLVKPDATIFVHAAERFGIDPARTLFIDDVPDNVAAAQGAGWQALHFQSPRQCEVELVRRGLL